MEIQFHPDSGLADVPGFQAGGARGGIKAANEDVGLLVADDVVPTAALFTSNRVKAAPVLISATHARHRQARAVVWNSGNANCCTGEQGWQDAIEMCRLAASKIGCDPHQVLVCSTGIIGHALPMEKVKGALQVLEVGTGEEFSQTAARAAMTTDTRPKHIAARAQINGQTVTVGGQIKGVGMIGPDMQVLEGQNLHATMLAFLATDARIERGFIEDLQRAVEKSFNSVTVDGDTSTNDTAILMASGESGVESHARPKYLAGSLRSCCRAVCIELSKMVARDGEGATKLVEVRVWARRRTGREEDRAFYRQLAAREDGDLRARPQLGPHRDGLWARGRHFDPSIWTSRWARSKCFSAASRWISTRAMRSR
jgi:glutamate N-acetyltransferase/amino-acid N-acetyltransferase